MPFDFSFLILKSVDTTPLTGEFFVLMDIYIYHHICEEDFGKNIRMEEITADTKTQKVGQLKLI
jgi:hypothetical protein